MKQIEKQLYKTWKNGKGINKHELVGKGRKTNVWKTHEMYEQHMKTLGKHMKRFEKVWTSLKILKSKKTHTHIYIYIYIY